MKAHKLPKLTVQEYIQQEVESGQKYEYHNGEIFALAGGSLPHGLLCGNIYSLLRNALKAKQSDCKPLNGEIKLHIAEKKSYVYPDAMVICGAIETAKDNEHAVTNPKLLVEVLSKSTADYDRGDKFYLYRQVSSLQEYVLIEQEKAVVEVFYKRQETDLWQIKRFEGLEDVVNLQSIDLEIKMLDLYEDIQI